MLHGHAPRRFVALATVCLALATSAASPALADPEVQPVGDVDPVSAPGPIPSGAPGTLVTPEGEVLTVAAAKESLQPVTALTNTPWSREYLVAGTFSGKVTGSAQSAAQGGVLEAGYQIGCGITQQDLHSITTAGITPGAGIPFIGGTLLPVFLGISATQQLRLVLEPGRINIVSVIRKAFDGDWVRVSITDLRIRVDGCAGQSFIRSFATFTSSTDDNAAVVTYLGVTRAV